MNVTILSRKNTHCVTLHTAQVNSEWHCTVVVYCPWENDDVGLHVLGCWVDILGTNSLLLLLSSGDKQNVLVEFMYHLLHACQV